MNETFQLRKGVKYQGVAFTALFLAAFALYSSIFFLEEPAKHGFKGEPSAAVVGGMGCVVFGAMLLLSIYMWASYYVERFTINGTVLSVRSMLQNRQFDVLELECLKWVASPMGGRILFRVLGSKARLNFYGFSRDDRLRIIRAMQDIVSPQVQEGWPLFCHMVALPLRDGKPSIVRSEPSLRTCTITRKRYDRMLMLFLPLSAVLAVVLWVWVNFWQFIPLPFVVIGAWLLLRFNVPREGRSEVRLTATSLGRAQLIGLSAVVLYNSGLMGIVESETSFG